MTDRSRRLVRNPDWATKILTDTYSALIDNLQLPLKMLPQITDLRQAVEGDSADIQARMEEYGCGTYGCVYPTNDPNIVLKLTTDDTEAEFAQRWASTLVRPICVTYYKVAKPNGAKDKDGHPVWMLWRESASGIGQLKEYVSDLAVTLVNVQHEFADDLYKSWYRGKSSQQSLSRKLDDWQRSCEDMYSIPELAPLAEGMVIVFKEQGIFFGDIHANNVGLVRRGDDREFQWVITDPGHIAVVDPQDF